MCLAPVSVLSDITAVLLGRSAYQAPPRNTGEYDLDSAQVERMRRLMGGQLQGPVYSQSRWYQSDLESAEHNADAGMMDTAARLMRAANRDGTLAGIMSTRTDGLVRLPKRFRGDRDVIEALEVGHDDARSVFDEMFPPTELALLARDGIELGVAVAELVDVAGRDYPVMVRLDPEFLVYRWNENTWYYRSIAGQVRITPGDGRWILHTPGGRMCPWTNGLWKAIGSAFIRKSHAQAHKDNWEAKLANPARVAVSPQGAGEQQKDSWFNAVMAWGINTVFGMTPGYDVKLIESNGIGWQSFAKTIEDANTEYQVCVAGQTVTTDGGTGFANADIHKSIRADLIKGTADGLSYTICTQGIPAFIAARYGIEAVATRACVFSWDVTPPKDRNSEANSVLTASTGLAQLTASLLPYGVTVDVGAYCNQYGIPVANDVDGNGVPDDAENKPQQPPQLKLIQGGAAGPGAPAGGAAAPAGGVGDAAASGGAEAPAPEANTALNGAQVTSLVEIVQAVAAGTLPRDAAIGILKRAFQLTDAQANEILGSAGQGFTIAPPAPAPAPAAKPEVAA